LESRFGRRNKLVCRQSRGSNQAAKRASRYFSVVWYRQRRAMAILNHYDVAGGLSGDFPAKGRKYARRFSAANDWLARHQGSTSIC
jgi:hypothetical protein